MFAISPRGCVGICEYWLFRFNVTVILDRCDFGFRQGFTKFYGTRWDTFTWVSFSRWIVMMLVRFRRRFSVLELYLEYRSRMLKRCVILQTVRSLVTLSARTPERFSYSAQNRRKARYFSLMHSLQFNGRVRPCFIYIICGTLWAWIIYSSRYFSREIHEVDEIFCKNDISICF